jgi:hypothetical protein
MKAAGAPIHFTFYGDLLGIAAAYNLGPEVAYSKLNRFYNTVFHRFEQLCNHHVPGGVQVQMFSDSVVMWGEFTFSLISPNAAQLRKSRNGEYSIPARTTAHYARRHLARRRFCAVIFRDSCLVEILPSITRSRS